MKNVGGISFGVDARINIYRGINCYAAVYFDNDKAKPTVLKIYNINKKMIVDYDNMIKEVAAMNYHTCRLCPEVRFELSWQN